MSRLKINFLLFAALALAACAAPATQIPTVVPTTAAIETATATVAASPTLIEASPTPAEPVRFAVIGDYGFGGEGEQAVAALIESWQVDFIVTTGDNNYPNGEAETIDANIGRFYYAYIGNYVGEFGPGSPENRFFPSIGNHDWNARLGFQPYLDYFSLPGNERYYDFKEGAVHFFVLNSDTNEPDGVGRSTVQAEWLRAGLSDSNAVWQVVVMHHPDYSSGRHTSTEWMQWPFAEWGADAVLAGHDHLYERLEVDGIPHFTNGLGGSPAIYDFSFIVPESVLRYNGMHGAMLVEATSEMVLLEFINIAGELIDSYTLTAED